jgi:hypothetical protein
VVDLDRQLGPLTLEQLDYQLPFRICKRRLNCYYRTHISPPAFLANLMYSSFSRMGSEKLGSGIGGLPGEQRVDSVLNAWVSPRLFYARDLPLRELPGKRRSPTPQGGLERILHVRRPDVHAS